MLITCGLTGLIFAFSGYILFRFPPKKRNWWYGYRTATSQKSQERWDFAQKYSGRIMVYLGLGTTGLGFLGSLFKLPLLASLSAGIAIPLAVCIYLIIATERALRRQFPEES